MRALAALLLVGMLGGSTLPAVDESPKPPDGWTQYTAKDKSFSVWLPEDQGKKTEKLKNEMPKKGLTLRFTTVLIEGKDGRAYEAATVTIMPYQGDITKLKAATRVDIIRDLFVDVAKGKLGDEKEVKQGRVPGKEFVIQTDDAFSRHRVYNFADRFFIVSVFGTKEQVKSKEADTFLDSYKIPERYAGPPEKGK